MFVIKPALQNKGLLGSTGKNQPQGWADWILCVYLTRRPSVDLCGRGWGTGWSVTLCSSVDAQKWANLANLKQTEIFYRRSFPKMETWIRGAKVLVFLFSSPPHIYLPSFLSLSCIRHLLNLDKDVNLDFFELTWQKCDLKSVAGFVTSLKWNQQYVFLPFKAEFCRLGYKMPSKMLEPR